MELTARIYPGQSTLQDFVKENIDQLLVAA
jgi:hypothetical protein